MVSKCQRRFACAFGTRLPPILFVTTSPVSTIYDTTYSRVTRQSHGWGDINYQYNPYIAGSVATHLASYINANSTLSAAGISASADGPLVTISAGSTVTVSPSGSGSTTATLGGGGSVSQVTNSVIANSAISYSYDALERTVNRMINGGNNNIAWTFDAMSRVTSELNALGSTPFTYSYVDDSPGSSKGDTRLASIGYPNGQTTSFNYLPTVQDERLQQIKNLTPSSSVLSQFNYAYNPAGEIKQWQQQQNATNSHFDLGYDRAGQLTSAVTDSGSLFKIYITGAVQAGDTLSITAFDASLTGSSGQETATYTVQSGDTIGSITSALSSNINSAMSNISVSASANTSAGIISISTSPNFTTSFRVSTSSGATEKLALSESTPIKNLHKQYYYAYDCAGNRTGVQGDSSGTLGTGLTTNATKYNYNNLNELVAIAPGGPITFSGTTVNPIKAASVNVAQTVTIGGTVTAGDTVGIMVHDRGLSQARKVSYIVQSGDTTTSIATALRNKINTDSTLTALGVSSTSASNVITVSSQSSSATTYTAFVSNGATETAGLNDSNSLRATIGPSSAFTAKPGLASGANSVEVTAVSGGGTKTSNGYSVTIASGISSALTYDDNGNLTSDGTNNYLWDAENRLIKITYPGTGNESQFSYDAFGRTVMMLELTAGTITASKQFVWCNGARCEERSATGALTKQFYGRGQRLGISSYFYTLQSNSSVCELVDPAGVLQAQYMYSPFGESTTALEALPSEFGYAGMYHHARSGLNFTASRVYSAAFGRQQREGAE